jgi:hypothetical protein
MTGPVLAGILAASTAEEVLRHAFDEAQHRAVALRVVAAGLDPDDEPALSELVERWAGKYPDVPVSVAVRGVVDPAITLTAATRHCGLAVLARPGDARTAAVVRAIARRASCPVVIAAAQWTTATLQAE